MLLCRCCKLKTLLKLFVNIHSCFWNPKILSITSGTLEVETRKIVNKTEPGLTKIENSQNFQTPSVRSRRVMSMHTKRKTFRFFRPSDRKVFRYTSSMVRHLQLAANHTSPFLSYFRKTLNFLTQVSFL